MTGSSLHSPLATHHSPLAKVILKPRRAQPFFARHPWVFAGAIEHVDGNPADGAEVELVSSAGNFVARGLFNSRSKIRVRLYSWVEGQAIDRELFRSRLASAIHFRDSLGLRGPDKGCRLVFSEADGLSGLAIDEYAGWLTMQFTALGIAERREEIVGLLEELISPKGIYLRTERGVGKLEGLEIHDGLIAGTPPPRELSIVENGVRFLLNLQEGQKTGFFLDQRDNRTLTTRFAKGSRVLDAFSYTGAFGLAMARAGAASVECVDASESALQLGRENAALNQLEGIQFNKGDVFSYLDRLVAEGRKYDMVILDPPKFARSRSAIPDAMKGYRRLQSLGIRLLDPDGILVTCCCSGLVTQEMLTELLAQLSGEEKRDIQILSRTGAAADHPVAATCLETAYLKCFISRVL